MWLACMHPPATGGIAQVALLRQTWRRPCVSTFGSTRPLPFFSLHASLFDRTQANLLERCERLPFGVALFDLQRTMGTQHWAFSRWPNLERPANHLDLYDNSRCTSHYLSHMHSDMILLIPVETMKAPWSTSMSRSSHISPFQFSSRPLIPISSLSYIETRP